MRRALGVSETALGLFSAGPRAGGFSYNSFSQLHVCVCGGGVAGRGVHLRCVHMCSFLLWGVTLSPCWRTNSCCTELDQPLGVLEHDPKVPFPAIPMSLSPLALPDSGFM